MAFESEILGLLSKKYIREFWVSGEKNNAVYFSISFGHMIKKMNSSSRTSRQEDGHVCFDWGNILLTPIFWCKNVVKVTTLLHEIMTLH